MLRGTCIKYGIFRPVNELAEYFFRVTISLHYVLSFFYTFTNYLQGTPF